MDPALIAALAAVVGVIVTVWRQLAQQAADRRNRLDDKFTSIVGNLGDKSTAVQASAVVSIINFLKPQYRDFHDQVFMVLLVNLKLRRPNIINNILVNGFEKAAQIRLKPGQDISTRPELDLSRCNLYHINLSGLDLSNADLAYTKMQNANLTGAILFRVRGIESNLENARLSRANMEEARLNKTCLRNAQLHDARLVSVTLKEADLTGAEFYRAKLQGAHFEGACINGARFEQANLSDAIFKNIKDIDEKTLRSISRAENWHKAHFDKDTRRQIQRLAEIQAQS